MASYITHIDPKTINPLGMLSSFKPDQDMIDKKLFSLIVDERDFKTKTPKAQKMSDLKFFASQRSNNDDFWRKSAQFGADDNPGVANSAEPFSRSGR